MRVVVRKETCNMAGAAQILGGIVTLKIFEMMVVKMNSQCSLAPCCLHDVVGMHCSTGVPPGMFGNTTNLGYW